VNSLPVEFGSPVSSDDHLRIVLQANLASWWGELLGRQEIGLHSDFFQLGGRPEHAANLVQRIKGEWGVVIQSSDLYEARTVSKLADLIHIKQSSREQLCIVPIRAEGSRQPLFLVHGVGGNILGFAGLARSLHMDQPVYGIQAQALDSKAPTLIRLEAMASFYVEELRRVQPKGPYAFLGFSFGGLVAYEMARQLTASGEQVRFLGMLDTWQPGHLKQLEVGVQGRSRRWWNRLKLVRLNTQKLSGPQLVAYIAGRLKGRVLRLAFGRLAAKGVVSLPESMRQVRDINLTAAARYVLEPYSGMITLFRAEDDPSLNLPEDLNWRRYAEGGVKIIRLPGDHGQILAEPNLSFMTRRLDEHLAPPDAVGGEVEEFELDENGLVNLKIEMANETLSVASSSLSPWMREAASVSMGPFSALGPSARKAAE
jgi:thioesterase domain-containing protein